MAAQPYDEWSYESYLDFERRSETRHEYHQGTVYAMSGGTREHTLISSNIIVSLGTQTADSGCEVYTSDILVAHPARDAAFYPDVSVACGEADFGKGNAGDILFNPTLIVEVLSASTEKKDTLIKLPIYQAMPSIREILYVRQDRVHVTHYTRDGNDWPTVFYRTLSDEITLNSINATLLVSDIYKRISFEPES